MQEEEQKQSQKMLVKIDERLSDDELSGSEVDSDELGDDIAQNRQAQP